MNLTYIVRIKDHVSDVESVKERLEEIASWQKDWINSIRLFKKMENKGVARLIQEDVFWSGERTLTVKYYAKISFQRFFFYFWVLKQFTECPVHVMQLNEDGSIKKVIYG